jgi:tRNA(Ile)-lysidine synthase
MSSGAARPPDAGSFDAKAFAAMAEEIRLRLLLRAIDRFGHEGPAELGKVESLLSALDNAVAETGKTRRGRLKQTLAGALVSLSDDRINIAPAPPRRRLNR